MDRSDIIPSLHLSNLRNNTSPVLALISDSTGLPGSFLGGCGQVSASQCLWAALKDGFRRQNPIATFNFDSLSSDAGNFAIGGAGWHHVLKVGDELNLQLPAWFTARSETWLHHVRSIEPDVLLFNLGINYAFLGHHPYDGPNLLQHLAQVLAALASWEKVPNVIFITNKSVNTAVKGGSGSFKPGPPAAYLGVAAALRTVARSNGALLNKNLPSALQHFGLIDIGRYFSCKVLGKDHGIQYFARAPAKAVERTSISLSCEPITLGHSTHGDFSFVIGLPGSGGGVIYKQGIRRLQLQMGHWKGQVLTLQFHNQEGAFSVKYTPVHFTSPCTLAGPMTRLPPGGLKFALECRQERLTILVNDHLYLSASVPRLISEGPITMSSAEPPTAPLIVRVLSFHEGLASSVEPVISEDLFFGGYGSTSVEAGGAYGGNGVNHPASIGVALVDYPAISAANLAASA